MIEKVLRDKIADLIADADHIEGVREEAEEQLATNIPSECRITNIDQNDAMILLHNANLCRMEFSESTANSGLMRRSKKASLLDHRIGAREERRRDRHT